MNKYKIISYVLLVSVVLFFLFTTYKVSGKDNKQEDEQIKSKALSEVELLDNNFQTIFNDLNNIKLENYKISATKIKEKSTSNASKNESTGTSNSSGGSNSSESSAASEESTSKEETSGEGDSKETTDNKKYELKEVGILTTDISNIDWDSIKNKTENMYNSLSVITLDLYQTNVNKQDIINFNNEYDRLTVAVNDENKEEVLKELALLYEYLPKFVENCASDEKDKIIYNTKKDIYKSYSILDKQEWGTISENLNNAAQEYTKLVTNVSNSKQSNANINKVYVMINDMQNAAKIQNKEIFLIKYKNVLEELQKI